ncbi:protein kinase domain-containing protein [Streptomyces canus]|uniref:protein kinase domain-containing protein n=1 Tax=Streptomyces canus TaxID=58343 RepID=UPI00074A2648|nr:protein kinase [Streptomyces canus]KUN07593.1 serine/threonine protein kinase [Streptomyces canus]
MSEDGEHPPDGRLIGGRYRLVERVGSGPSGTVWRARDEQDGQEERYVAVKEPRLTGDPEDEERRRAMRRLPHEARAAAQIDHPAAVAIHDVLLDDELPWIVMELVEGESLEAALAGRGPLADAEAARIALAVLGALHAAHRVGIVHRDLKPSNVLLEAGGERVVVTDFGIGASGRGNAQEAAVGFVAPECGSGRVAGPASDLWSLGALLRAAGEPRLLGSGPLGSLVERLLAPEPEARPTAEEAAEVLAEVAGTSLPTWAAQTPAPQQTVQTDASPPAPEAPTRAPAPTDLPHPTPTAEEPRRLTALSALGLLLQKKPERG